MKLVHRWMGLAMVMPFLVWTVTGLLFALKPGWGPAYEMLSPWQEEPAKSDTIFSLAEFAEMESAARASKIELHWSAIGPVYTVVHDRDKDARTLHDARTGTRIDPLTVPAAKTLVDSAIARSIAPARYGQHTSQEVSEGKIAFTFSGGPTVSIDQQSASIRQRGPDTDRINWYYKMHYVQWTGHKLADRILGLVVIVLVWLLAGAGMILAWRSRRSR